MKKLSPVDYDPKYRPLVTAITALEGDLKMLLGTRVRPKLADGDQQRELEFILTANIFLNDHETYCQPALYARMAWSERIDKSRVPGGAQENFETRSTRYKEAQQELGYSMGAPRWHAVHGIIIADKAPTVVGEELWKKMHTGKAGRGKAPGFALGYLREGLAGLRRLYSYSYGIFNR
jgi:hypothetical protein